MAAIPQRVGDNGRDKAEWGWKGIEGGLLLSSGWRPGVLLNITGQLRTAE